MERCWHYFLFVVWFSYLIVCSILLFTNGFLLNKAIITKDSTCISPLSTCSSNDLHTECIDKNSRPDIPICLPQKSRVILLVIDAFRYDFALHNEELIYPLPYENKMPFINKLMTENPSFNRLYKFIADPPTTTMQRLKAITTGSLPTFIDAGSNFASTAISEDNFLNQLVANKREVVFLGDDTWTSLYPNHFLRSYPYPSFNVWDLDTVDTGINKYLYKELKEKDWTLLIAHYLGVDHCGHRYGPNHPEMSRKLKEMNEVIKNITMQMDDDVILFVIGDHGMTGTGDHGGESIDEITAALFVHSKLPLFVDNSDSVKQVDLIPTLSTIMGVPIPYCNLGTVIPSCLPLIGSKNINATELASIFWTNVQQMTLYIKDYSDITNTFNTELLEKFKIDYTTLKNSLASTNLNYEAFIKDCMEYMISLRKMCEEEWVQFDSFSMTRGLLLCFIPVFFVYTLVNGVPSEQLSLIFSKYFIIFIYLSTIITTIASAICVHFSIADNLLMTAYFFSGMTAVFILALVLVQNWDLVSMNWYESSKKRCWVEVFCRFILLISVCALFSNSFVVQECYVSLFLLVTLVFITIINLITSTTVRIAKTVKNTLKSSVKIKLFTLTVIFCLLIRLSMYYWQCREEQNCAEFFSQKYSNANRIELILALISVGLVITLTRTWLRYCGNLAAFNITTLVAQYTPTVIIVCCGGFWVLHNFVNDDKPISLRRADTLALIAYVFIIVGFGITYIKPITAFVISKNVNIQSHSNIVPKLFHQVKSLLHEKSERKDVPIVCGLGTIYSSTFIIVSVYLLLLFVLVLGDGAAPSAVLLFFSAAIILCISSITRYEKATNIDDLLQVPTVTILTWVSLAIYFFYGTGHQPTFPNITWDAAFVGTGGNFTNNYVPAALILINTFGSYIIMGFLLPLLQIAPFTIYTIITTLGNKKKEQKDLSRGDVLLFENNQLLLTKTFALTCKYLCCLAIRVFATMLAATIHCRHLMVWKIFAPKLIFEAISLFVTIPSVLLGYVLLISINSAAKRLIHGLDKER